MKAPKFKDFISEAKSDQKYRLLIVTDEPEKAKTFHTANRLRDALTVLKAKQKKKKKTMWSRRAQEYEAKILSGNLVSIAEVLKELYKKDSFDEASFSEKQIYASALDRLARELAAMKKLDKETATKELENILKSAA